MIERPLNPTRWNGARSSGQSRLVRSGRVPAAGRVREEVPLGEAPRVLEMDEGVVERHRRAPGRLLDRVDREDRERRADPERG